jgi:hypothetical protein
MYVNRKYRWRKLRAFSARTQKSHWNDFAERLRSVGRNVFPSFDCGLRESGIRWKIRSISEFGLRPNAILFYASILEMALIALQQDRSLPRRSCTPAGTQRLWGLVWFHTGPSVCPSEQACGLPLLVCRHGSCFVRFEDFADKLFKLSRSQRCVNRLVNI